MREDWQIGEGRRMDPRGMQALPRDLAYGLKALIDIGGAPGAPADAPAPVVEEAPVAADDDTDTEPETETDTDTDTADASTETAQES